MTYRLRNIVVAVGLALVAAMLTTFYVANYKRHVRQTESTVKVFVAKRDIPQGTTGTELIKRGSLVTADVVQRTVVPGAISNLDQVQSLLTTQPIYAGEQVTLRRFASHQQQGIRSQLHGPLRAVSLPGTADQLLAGTLKDGDHVDVIANIKTGDCSTCFAVRDVARNVLVLHAPTGVTAESKVSADGASAILAVSDRKEAQKIWYAVENSAGWSLQLRPVANATEPSVAVEGVWSVLEDSTPATSSKNYVGGRP
jgi:Flp pilus assembly protein CpaB